MGGVRVGGAGNRLVDAMKDHRRVLEPTNGEAIVVTIIAVLMLAVAVFGGPGVPW